MALTKWQKLVKKYGIQGAKKRYKKKGKRGSSSLKREKISSDTWRIPIDEGMLTFNEDDRRISLDLGKRDFTLVAKRMKKKTKIKEIQVDPNLVDVVGFSSYRTLRLGRYLEINDTG